MKNKFCDMGVLANEAAVETWFVVPLLDDLGYVPGNIRLKTSLQEIKVGKGSKSALYRPDYMLLVSGVPSLVIDAKSPLENVLKFEQQCSSYCLEINKAFEYNPVEFYMLTNGARTLVYKWDSANPVSDCTFEDFVSGNPAFSKLTSLISRKSLETSVTERRTKADNSRFSFGPVTLSDLSARFQKIHQFIWTREKMSPSAAFEELIKVLFVKLQKDRELRAKLGKAPEPKLKDVVFSIHWITGQTENENPINDPLFRNLVRSLEMDIQAGSKKRFFDLEEQINLSPETLKFIVKELQHVDLISMEEDVHGRMFETFLDATVRGRDLGQFFTPRDIVNLMVELADLKITKMSASTVLDACCGSGGFLIASMARLTTLADKMVGLSKKERSNLIAVINNESLFGIDAGSDPAIHRIARMNMYLHGDGGSHIYHADSLDKGIASVGRDSIENTRQLEEVQKLLVESEKKFDVILSNPPFSLKYSRDDDEQARVMRQYAVSIDRDRGKVLGSLLSSIMFLERYKDLCKPEGEVLAIIDESVLSGQSYSYVRGFIRDNFIIVGVISLPGDAFRRASARVKTSILILRPRGNGDEQAEVFMARTVYLGLEPRIARRIGVPANRLDVLKQSEMSRVIADYRNFKAGAPGPYVVDASRLTDRLDVKFCIGDSGRKASVWESQGREVIPIGKALIEVSGRETKVSPLDSYQFLRVNYNGDVGEGDLIDGEDCSYSTLFHVQNWDVLISNINLSRGAVGIVPPHLHGRYVSGEYTIVRAASDEEAVYYCALLRTKEILGDVLAATTGMGRGRIRWNDVASVKVPQYQEGNSHIKQLVADLKRFWLSYHSFLESRDSHMEESVAELEVDGEDARYRWLSFKPPE